MPAKSKLREIEGQHGKTADVLLPELFLEHRTQIAVARALGVSQGTLAGWIAALGLEQVTVLVPRRARRPVATVDPAQLALPIPDW